MINKGFALARGMTWRAGVDKEGGPPLPRWKENGNQKMLR